MRGEIGMDLTNLAKCLQECLDSLPFVPRKDQDYYYVTVAGDIKYNIYSRSTVDMMFVLAGNCFRSEDAAKLHRDVIRGKCADVLNGKWPD